MIITLCGSTRFKDDFDRVNKKLTRQGHVVMTISYAAEKDDAGNEKEPAVKEILDMVHFKKILLSDGIVVVGHGYIGYSTAREIIWADMNEKLILDEDFQWPDLLDRAKEVLHVYR